MKAPRSYPPAIRKRILCMLGITMAFLVSSCEKDHMFDFLKSTGDIITVEREVSYFDEVMLEDNIDLVLSQGNFFNIRLEGGENLLPGIDTEIADSILTLRNNNTYNWVRSYDKKITAYVTAPHFFRIGYKGTGTLMNTDTLREDSIFVTSYAGSGYIDLCIKTSLSHFGLNSGSADITVSGYSGSNFIYAGSYGPFHCLDLHTMNTYMSNRGTNDCHVRVQNTLEYEIKGLGNIYYAGKPGSITGTITGEGKLIPLE